MKSAAEMRHPVPLSQSMRRGAKCVEKPIGLLLSSVSSQADQLPRPDYATAFGSKPDQCCIPKLCGKICNSSMWQAKPGDVLGSTVEECCSPRDCDDVLCKGNFAKKPRRHDAADRPILLQGSTQGECCEPISCGRAAGV